MDLPLIHPNPPRLSDLQRELLALEASGIFTNNGPLVRRFENELVEQMFGGEGACLAVASATMGLIITIREAIGLSHGDGRYALMPAFTFAATAHAAIWAGLKPLLCDIDSRSWLPDSPQEEALLARYGSKIAVMVPYAAFGRSLDLDRYHWLSRRYEVPLVVDAASSLGTVDSKGRNFGTGSHGAFVYSMHATKTFATAEGGVIYSVDRTRIERLRAMTNYGFEQGRSATMPGLNAKISEVGALMALAKLAEIEGIADRRAKLAAHYRAKLPDFGFQPLVDHRQAMQFMPLLLPPVLIPYRTEIVAKLAAASIGAGTYFSPHLAEQPYFQAESEFGPLPISDDIAGRIMALPITDMMVKADVDRICTAFRHICATLAHPIDRRIRPREPRRAAG